MRDHSTHKVGSRHEVIGALMSRWLFERRTEVVPVAQAQGRVCATTVVSKNQLPNALTCNMDAIAVRFDDFAQGMPDISGWERGVQWQFANTGIAMPEGFDTAIAIENVTVSEDNQTLEALDCAPDERFQSTSMPGSTLEVGEVLVQAGEVLTPTLIACLTMGGHVEVEVVARPRVMYIPTGNELVPAEIELPRGKNVESNGNMICAKLEQWGAEPRHHAIVPDDPDQILAALREGTAWADIVVINAGSSKGSDDWTCELLEREGEVLFHEVSQGPGRHCSFSLLDQKPVIGISGPPLGAEFTTDFFVKPFVDLYLGAAADYPPTVMAVMLDDCPSSPRPMSFVRRAVLRRDEDDQFVAWVHQADPDEPVLKGSNQANALIVVDKDSYGWERGDRYPVELRYPYTLPPRL
ncbi:MAG: molybdopterin molybdotransferase MoeA [Coriobacteriia bacterium]|nr:molybdopterin molybdotransferase MoeA [Coriobacteriia bacterium]